MWTDGSRYAERMDPYGSHDATNDKALWVLMGFVVLLVLLSALKELLSRWQLTIRATVETVDVTPQNSLSLLRIVGTPVGLWAWILGMLGMGRTYELHASERLITVKAPGILRETHVVMPVSQLAVVSARYVLPLSYLYYGVALGAFFTFVDHPSWFFVMVSVALVLCFINREFRIAVSAGAGYYGFNYKLRSNMSKAHLFLAVEQLRMLLVRAQENNAMSALSSTVLPAQPQQLTAGFIPSCNVPGLPNGGATRATPPPWQGAVPASGHASPPEHGSYPGAR